MCHTDTPTPMPFNNKNLGRKWPVSNMNTPVPPGRTKFTRFIILSYKNKSFPLFSHCGCLCFFIFTNCLLVHALLFFGLPCLVTCLFWLQGPSPQGPVSKPTQPSTVAHCPLLCLLFFFYFASHQLWSLGQVTESINLFPQRMRGSLAPSVLTCAGPKTSPIVCHMLLFL